MTDANLDQLKALSDSFVTKAQRVLTDFNDPEVIPRERDRRDFKEDMETLKEAIRQTEAWIEKVKQNPSPEPQPNPNPQPLEPVKVEVKGFFVVGKENSKDYAVATQSWQKECDAVRNVLRAKFSGVFHSFSCGGSSNISQWANIDYFQLASSPVFVMKLRPDVRYEIISEGSVAGTANEKDAYVPWQSWWSACEVWMKNQTDVYGAKLIAASCGVPRNVSQWENIGYKQYASTGNVYVMD